jgi:hypothetical protein
MEMGSVRTSVDQAFPDTIFSLDWNVPREDRALIRLLSRANLPQKKPEANDYIGSAFAKFRLRRTTKQNNRSAY